MIGAVCYAELGTSIPRSGGDYAYVLEAFGPLTAFLRLWVTVLVVQPATLAVLSLTFATYMVKPLYPDCEPPDLALRLMAIVCLCLLTYVNCKSVKLAMKVQDVFTTAKLAALALIIITGIVRIAQGEVGYLRNSFEGEYSVGGISLSFYVRTVCFRRMELFELCVRGAEGSEQKPAQGYIHRHHACDGRLRHGERCLLHRSISPRDACIASCCCDVCAAYNWCRSMDHAGVCQLVNLRRPERNHVYYCKIILYWCFGGAPSHDIWDDTHDQANPDSASSVILCCGSADVYDERHLRPHQLFELQPVALGGCLHPGNALAALQKTKHAPTDQGSPYLPYCVPGHVHIPYVHAIVCKPHGDWDGPCDSNYWYPCLLYLRHLEPEEQSDPKVL
uniref:Putative amino acid transporter n=1 Tax=Rhipicephalus microplus TaxID=6941 RepID=A0A6G5AEL8_RHIMP